MAVARRHPAARNTIRGTCARAGANAALRLRNALDGSDVWGPLALVAQYIVFHRARGGGNPLYNHVENKP